MGGRIGRLLPTVARPRHHGTVDEHDGAHRYFTGGAGEARLVESQPHRIVVEHDCTVDGVRLGSAGERPEGGVTGGVEVRGTRE